jgi:AbrB family looped-hinge helix DNA binding protein
MSAFKTKVGEGGRIVIPAEYRKALGIKPGDTVLMAVKEGEVRIWTFQQAVKRFRESVRRYIPEDRDLAAELIQERRAEAAREYDSTSSS